MQTCASECGTQRGFSKYESTVDDLVADHPVTSEKFYEAEPLLFTMLYKKYKTILFWDVEIQLKIKDVAKLPHEQEEFHNSRLGTTEPKKNLYSNWQHQFQDTVGSGTYDSRNILFKFDDYTTHASTNAPIANRH